MRKLWCFIQRTLNMKKFLFLFIASFMTFVATAQDDFMDEALRISNDKESYITLNDGTEIVGTVKDLDRKKGLFEEVTIKKEDGKKMTFKPEDIKFMYLPPSGFSKFTVGMDKMTDINKINKDASNSSAMMRPGYFYFETSEVMIKDKKRTLLLQMLNPSFSSKIKVFNDPYAKETMSAGIGGMTLAGGDSKSYYVKVGDEPAFRLFKKNYDEELVHLYKDCASMKESYPDGLFWSKFSKHIFAFDASACQ